MSRELLGDFAKGLDDVQLGTALAGSMILAGPEIAMTDRWRPSGDRSWRWPEVATMSQKDAIKAWLALVGPLRIPGTPTRNGIALGSAFSPWMPWDAAWVAETVGRGEHVAAFHYITAPPQPHVEWTWPLDVGLFGDQASRGVREVLDSVHWKDFVVPVRAGDATLPIEVLLCGSDLATAMRAAMKHRGLPRVQAVIVLGGAGALPSPVVVADALRVAARADAVCVADVPAADRSPFLDHFLRELAHDLDLDVAFADACRSFATRPPLMVACQGGFERAHVSEWGRNLTSRMKRMPDTRVAANGGPPAPAPEVAADLEERFSRGGFGSELGDASDISKIGHRVGLQVPQPPGRARHLAARLHDAAGKVVESQPLQHGSYRLDVWIGPPESGVMMAPVVFPDHELPPDQEHELTVVLTAPGVVEAPLIRTLRLPPAGKSAPVELPLTIPQKVKLLDARITVLHGNRILQTIRFQAAVGAGDRAPLALGLEMALRHDLDGAMSRRLFDASLLFNDSAGTPSMSLFKDQNASFVELGDLDPLIATIQKILEDATNRPERHGKPDTKDSSELLAELARNGAQLRKSLFRQRDVQDELAAATRIQIVAAKVESILPLEICYQPEAPAPGAKTCPNWKEALDKGACTKKCPADQSTVVCPVGFWGTSKVIERRAFDKKLAREVGAADFALLPEPTNQRTGLDVFDGALCAAAAEARKFDPKGVDRAFKKIIAATGKGKEVADWKAWTTEVSTTTPALLTLLAHTDLENTIRTLVIGQKQNRLLTQINEELVGKPGSGGGSLVLLLGCSTATSEAFQSFVVEFTESGAKIVVGTLCKILGRHAAPIAEKLVSDLVRVRKKRPDTPFGDVMTWLRRSLLASGFPIILAVTAFGDADWRV